MEAKLFPLNMNMIIFYKIIFIIAAYLFGSIPIAYIWYKAKTGGDIREQGSGNVGGTNIARTVGATAGVITILIDVLKGFLPIMAVYFLFPDDLILVAITTVMVVLGHNYSIYLNFKGGKGISTSFGAIIGLCSFPLAGSTVLIRILPMIIILAVWLLIFIIFRIVSLSSLIAAVATPLSFYFSKYPLAIVIAAIFLFILTFIAHRDNIKRLIKKEEKKLKRKGA
ncbi:MAG: glycerol-3-phosphate 1-O-acyltransferase PlsY [Actinomycetia bacterium]|nr:glycerol-3-phosphate 1-O-acyltransferase PlsY [Actinomycetes bacterium]